MGSYYTLLKDNKSMFFGDRFDIKRKLYDEVAVNNKDADTYTIEEVLPGGRRVPAKETFDKILQEVYDLSTKGR